MKFVTPPLKKFIFFLLSLIALCGTLQLAAQQKPPVIDIAKILLSDTIDYRSVCFQDSLHTVKLSQLPALNFTKAPKNVFRHLNAKQMNKTGGFVSGCRILQTV